VAPEDRLYLGSGYCVGDCDWGIVFTTRGLGQCNLVSMSDLSFTLDLGPINAAAEQIAGLDDALKNRAKLLAGQAHAHIVEEVQSKLHTRRSKYLEGLVSPKEISPGIYMITLDSKAAWIEEGKPAGSMVDDLLRKSPHGNAKSGPKTAKDGSIYRIIPFEHNKSPTKQTQAEQTLTATIRSELKKLKLPWGKEKDAAGAFKTGYLRQAWIQTPDRPGFAVSTPGIEGGPANQHGFGHGAIGQPMQGPKASGSRPFLEGLRFYQNPVFEVGKDGQQRPKMTKSGSQQVDKSAVTFRIVSSKHKGKLWEHPGLEGCHFFDSALQWIRTEWDTKMLPELLQQFNMS
jgi:hypothetical protein